MQSPAEIGVLPVTLTNAGIEDPLFQGLPTTQNFLQWHSVAVTELPADTTVLARSDLCAIQSIRVGKNAWSMQYHAET